MKEIAKKLTTEFKNGDYNIFDMLNFTKRKSKNVQEGMIMEPTVQETTNNEQSAQEPTKMSTIRLAIENKFEEYNVAIDQRDSVIEELHKEIQELNYIIETLNGINNMLRVESAITSWKDVPNGTAMTAKFAKKLINKETDEDTDALSLLYLCAYKKEALSLQHRIIIDFAKFVSNVIMSETTEYEKYEFNWNETNAIELWIEKYYEYLADETNETV